MVVFIIIVVCIAVIAVLLLSMMDYGNHCGDEARWWASMSASESGSYRRSSTRGGASRTLQPVFGMERVDGLSEREDPRLITEEGTYLVYGRNGLHRVEKDSQVPDGMIMHPLLSHYDAEKDRGVAVFMPAGEEAGGCMFQVFNSKGHSALVEHHTSSAARVVIDREGWIVSLLNADNDGFISATRMGMVQPPARITHDTCNMLGFNMLIREGVLVAAARGELHFWSRAPGMTSWSWQQSVPLGGVLVGYALGATDDARVIVATEPHRNDHSGVVWLLSSSSPAAPYQKIVLAEGQSHQRRLGLCATIEDGTVFYTCGTREGGQLHQVSLYSGAARTYELDFEPHHMSAYRDKEGRVNLRMWCTGDHSRCVWRQVVL